MSKFNDFIFEELGPADQFKKIKFLTEEEEKKNSSFNILLLTSESDENESKIYITAQRFIEECKKKRIECHLLFTEYARLELDDNGDYIAYNKDDKKGFKVDSDMTVAINRGSVMEKFNARNIISQLERKDVFCINSRSTVEICSDKYRTMLRVVDSGLSSPKTVLIQSMETLEDSVEQIGSDFPYILKTLSGSKGVGVIYVESMKSLVSMVQLIWKINEDEEMILQEYMETDFDVRAHVLGDEVICAMKRYVAKDDFRSNYSQGGKVENYEPSDYEKEVCIKAAKSVGASWSGVDYILKDGEPMILEVNNSPGTEGIEKATKRNIVDEVLDWIGDKENWSKVAKEVGYKEMVKVNGMDLIAKFDTGNGVFCVMHADKYKINTEEKTVKWWSHGKKFKNKYTDMEKIEVGGAKKYFEERPHMFFDIIFNGKIYKNVNFTIDDRSDRTPVLLDRDFMERANVSVNPAKQFVITVEETK